MGSSAAIRLSLFSCRFVGGFGDLRFSCHRVKGLWLLTGLPLALYWPSVLVLIAWAVSRNRNACT